LATERMEMRSTPSVLAEIPSVNRKVIYSMGLGYTCHWNLLP
jgi:hypothetical protein